MEQSPSSPERSPELPSVAPVSDGEALGTGQSPEAATSGVIERQESRGEAAPAGAPVQAVPIFPTAPIVAQPSATTDDTTQAAVASPSVASDDDLIEREWVDRAKKVLAETKDDPYRREQEVNRLQADYLLKRYGRELRSLSES